MPLIQVQNLDQVVSQMNRIRHGYNERDVAKVLLEEGGKPLRDDLRTAAPLGPTGNLRRAIQARIARARALAPAVYVSVNRSIAHHLHLVTGGTKPHEERPKSRRALKVPLNFTGLATISSYFARVVHHPGAKANDYFARTWEAAADALARRISDGLGKLWDRAA